MNIQSKLLKILFPFQNVSGIKDHLNDLKNIFDDYDIMTVGEASSVSAEEGAEWVGGRWLF